MKATSLDPVTQEYRTVVGRLGRVQRRCSDVMEAQAAEIERLRAEVMCLRGELIARDTALAIAREERAALEAAIPGLPRRLTLARKVDHLLERLQELMRERINASRGHPGRGLADLRRKAVLCVGRDTPELGAARRIVERAGGALVVHAMGEDERPDLGALEASLAAADLVICQTGCVSHDAYWRVQDHCLRTGKQCVMVGQSAIPMRLSAVGAGG